MMRHFDACWGLWKSEKGKSMWTHSKDGDTNSVLSLLCVCTYSTSSDFQRPQWISKCLIIFHVLFYVGFLSGDLFTFSGNHPLLFLFWHKGFCEAKTHIYHVLCFLNVCTTFLENSSQLEIALLYSYFHYTILIFWLWNDVEAYTGKLLNWAAKCRVFQGFVSNNNIKRIKQIDLLLFCFYIIFPKIIFRVQNSAE